MNEIKIKKTLGETPFSQILKPFLIMPCNCTAIGLCSALKMNECLGSAADPDLSLTQRFSAACSACSSWSTDSLPLCDNSLFRELLYKRKFIRHCCKYRAVFVTCAELPCMALTNTASGFHAWAPRPCWNSIHWDGMSPLRWRESLLSALVAIFLFRGQPVPRALPLISSQGPARKKQRGRGSQHSEMSELTPVVPPHNSLSPHREFLPIIFTCPDQHPFAAARDMVSFGGAVSAPYCSPVTHSPATDQAEQNDLAPPA